MSSSLDKIFVSEKVGKNSRLFSNFLKNVIFRLKYEKLIIDECQNDIVRFKDEVSEIYMVPSERDYKEKNRQIAELH